MAENFPNLGKETSKLRKHRVPDRMNSNWPKLNHKVTKMAKVKDNKTILQATRMKQQKSYIREFP